jgi:hypothetical protein
LSFLSLCVLSGLWKGEIFMTPPFKTEGVPGRCRARHLMMNLTWMGAIDGIIDHPVSAAAQDIDGRRIDSAI